MPPRDDCESCRGHARRIHRVRRVSDEASRRIEELEIRVAFQDELLATLSGQVAALDRELRALREQLARARESLESLRDAQGHDAGSEPPPPHY